MPSPAVSPRCPYCNGSDVVRAQRKGLGYPWRRWLTKAYLYRCRECHRSFWQSQEQERARKIKKWHGRSSPEATGPEDILPGPERGLTVRQYAFALILSFLVSLTLILIFGKK